MTGKQGVRVTVCSLHNKKLIVARVCAHLGPSAAAVRGGVRHEDVRQSQSQRQPAHLPPQQEVLRKVRDQLGTENERGREKVCVKGLCLSTNVCSKLFCYGVGYNTA